MAAAPMLVILLSRKRHFYRGEIALHRVATTDPTLLNAVPKQHYHLCLCAEAAPLTNLSFLVSVAVDQLLAPRPTFPRSNKTKPLSSKHARTVKICWGMCFYKKKKKKEIYCTLTVIAKPTYGGKHFFYDWNKILWIANLRPQREVRPARE